MDKGSENIAQRISIAATLRRGTFVALVPWFLTWFLVGSAFAQPMQATPGTTGVDTAERHSSRAQAESSEPPAADTLTLPPTDRALETPMQRARRLGIPQSSAIPNRISARLRILGRDLNLLSASNTSYIVDGIVSMLMGGVSITLGALSDSDAFANYLYVFGASSAIRGLLVLALTPNTTDPAVTYAHMPMGSVQEVLERLAYGESALESIARRSKILRMTEGGLGVATGLLAIPVYFVPNDFRVSDASDVFVIVAAAISLITGIVSLSVKSNAERRWLAYQDLRERLIRQRRQELLGDLLRPTQRGPHIESYGLSFAIRFS